MDQLIDGCSVGQSAVASGMPPMTCHFERSEKSRLNVRNRVEHPGIGLYTAKTQRTRRKKVFDKNYSGLCELCASVMTTSP
ncbi:MAG: hypothetical protein ACXWYM_23885, partial [Candidatus Binatia bacterium]